MRILVSILFLTLSFFTFAEEAKMKTYQVSVKVPGMVCQMCVQGMRKNFKTVVKDMEKDITVDLDKKIVRLNLIKKIDNKEIEKRVKDAGYNAKKITWVN